MNNSNISLEGEWWRKEVQEFRTKEYGDVECVVVEDLIVLLAEQRRRDLVEFKEMLELVGTIDLQYRAFLYKIIDFNLNKLT